MKPKLSVVLATYNEAENIGACLGSVRNLADEIIVVDGDSQDQTRKIARSFGAKVIKTTNKPIFHLNKQFGVDQAGGDWIFQLDADERISPELAAEIRQTMSQNSGPRLPDPPVAYWVKRKNYFLGKFLTKGGIYPDPVIRFFRKGKAHLPCRSVHEQFEVKGEVGRLEHDLIHLADPTFARYLKRQNRYTSLMAREMLETRESLGPVSLIKYFLLEPLYWFWLIYLRHKGFVDGFPGFVFALGSALRFPIAYIKYWEFKVQKKTEINLKQDWD